MKVTSHGDCRSPRHLQSSGIITIIPGYTGVSHILALVIKVRSANMSPMASLYIYTHIYHLRSNQVRRMMRDITYIAAGMANMARSPEVKHNEVVRSLYIDHRQM